MGGIVSDFTSNVYLRLADIDKDTIAARYFGILVRFRVYVPIVQNDSGPRLPFKKFTSHCHISSRDISPMNREPRLLPIYIYVGDVPTFLCRHRCLIYLSFENDVT